MKNLFYVLSILVFFNANAGTEEIVTKTIWMPADVIAPVDGSMPDADVFVCPWPSHVPKEIDGQPGEFECVCAVGYELDSGECSPCISGSFKDEAGNTSCTGCSQNMKSTKGAALCVCDKGYEPDTSRSPSQCTECSSTDVHKTKFKDQVGNTSCLSCSAMMSCLEPDGSGSVTEITEECSAIHVFQGGAWTTQLGAHYQTQCLCNPGFAGPPGGPCTKCAENYVAANPNTATCTQCHSNDHKVSNDARTACVCDKGYSGKIGSNACFLCFHGEYKDSIGNQDCSECPKGSTHNLQASTDVNDCLCATGYTLNAQATKCVVCAAGKFKNKLGSESCSDCLGNTYSLEGASSCLACATGSEIPKGGTRTQASDCQCSAGYEPDGSNGCKECAAGKFKAGVGTEACVDCGAAGTGTDNTFQPLTGQSNCESCFEHSTSNAGAQHASTDCKCNAGYYFDSSDPSNLECKQCDRGKYKEAPASNNPCIHCGTGKYNDQLGSTSETACTDCFADSTHALTGQDEISDCKCNAGFQVAASGTACETCDDGHYCAGNGQKQACNSDMETRPMFTTKEVEGITITVGADDVNDCTCKPGYRGLRTCALCSPDHFCPGGQLMYRCREHSSAVAGSDDPGDCVCGGGYHKGPIQSEEEETEEAEEAAV